MPNISNIFFFLSDTNIHTLCIDDEVHNFRIVTCIFEQLNWPEMARLVCRVGLFWLNSGRWGSIWVFFVWVYKCKVTDRYLVEHMSSCAWETVCFDSAIRDLTECWTSLSEKTLKSLIMKYNYTLFHCGPAEILLHLNVPVCLANVLLWVLSEIWPLSKSLRWFTRLRQIDWAFLTARPTSPHCQATLHVFFVFFF